MAGNPELTRLAPLISEAAAVAGEGDLQRVLTTLVEQARVATGANYVALGVLGDHGVLSEFIYTGVDADVARQIGHVPTGSGVLGTVIRENRTIVLDRISDHPDSVGFPEHHPPMESFLGVPVAVGDEAFGNLYLSDKPGGFGDRDVEVVQALSRIAGAAVQTARLQSRLRRIAIVEDRQRIARDLHDSVIQDLFAVGLSLQGVGARVTDEDTERLLIDSIDTLDAAVNALRAYIFGLRETGQPATGLDDRLQLLVARMGSAYTARVELDLENVTTGEWDDEIVMLATEALSNALRHSGAENVIIRVLGSDDDLVLEVNDDGRGFDTSQPAQGMGLANMAARAKALGGTLTILSTPGEGTGVQARLPLSSARPVN
jgi:signal transduction histidine kinase